MNNDSNAPEINAKRYTRQADIIPADRMANLTVTVVGVGAIGRQVALQLAAMGTSKLQLIDFDRVEIENLCCQGYLENDREMLKVNATSRMCRMINSQVAVEQIGERFQRSASVGEVLFCCVDSIDTRKFIWQAVKDRVSVLVDTRMSASVARVIAVVDSIGREHYPTTLFGAGEAYQGSCTAKSTIYTANIAAGLAIAQFTKWLCSLPVDPDICLNILASEMSAGPNT
ncbi:MAG: ThiF family adenylyltransferase [Phycisphaerales bacterium]|jgi:molybdopterin-synthase adenylyltransferase|nr:ThiF family adenylyltransferase [Phycisphaerales bacterium]